MNIVPINSEFHSQHNFKEQLFALYYQEPGYNNLTCSCNKYMFCSKSLIAVGDFGSVSFYNDLNMTPAEYMDYLVEKENVIGFYHTHPQGIKDFSNVDTRMQETLAISCGNKPIWHAVQAYGSDVAKIICYEFIKGSYVVRHDLGFVMNDPFDDQIILPYKLSDIDISHTGTVIVKKGKSHVV